MNEARLNRVLARAKNECFAESSLSDEIIEALTDAAELLTERDLLVSALHEIITINEESAGACRKRMGTRRGNSIVTASEALARLTINQ